MHILYLGPPRPAFEARFAAVHQADTVERFDGPLTPEVLRWADLTPSPDWIISFGYRHKVPPAVLAAYPRKVLNLHIGYLPWNRGADPTFWSIVEGTPTGVTIHEMDENFDTGPILKQAQVVVYEADTFRTLYDRLQQTLEDLFWGHWPIIRLGPGGYGTSHTTADRAALDHYLQPLGWDTPVAGLQRLRPYRTWV